MHTRIATVLLAGLALGCRGEPPVNRNDLNSLVDSLKPDVERAAGLPFKGPIKVATRNRDQLRAFLIEKMDEELTPELLRGTEHAYRLLGLLPDSLNLESFMLALLTEQVAGFYDPKTSTLYGMEGTDRAVQTLTMAHEMVHALQHQYLPLDSIMAPQADDDRQLAARAILEGQATVVSVRVILPEGTDIPAVMSTLLRDQVSSSYAAMPVFSSAPLVIKEQLLVPYLAGADFMLWWSASPRKDTVPYGPLMPRSSEQILQPERYARGDEPVTLRFTAADEAIYENTFGDLDIRSLAAVMAGASEIATRLSLGWGGDRFRVYETPDGPALVWYIVWDDSTAADRFHRGTGAALAERSRPNYRLDLARLMVDGAPATRISIAPTTWARWEDLPKVRVASSE